MSGTYFSCSALRENGTFCSAAPQTLTSLIPETLAVPSGPPNGVLGMNCGSLQVGPGQAAGCLPAQVAAAQGHARWQSHHRTAAQGGRRSSLPLATPTHHLLPGLGKCSARRQSLWSTTPHGGEGAGRVLQRSVVSWGPKRANWSCCVHQRCAHHGGTGRDLLPPIQGVWWAPACRLHRTCPMVICRRNLSLVSITRRQVMEEGSMSRRTNLRQQGKAGRTKGWTITSRWPGRH